MNTNYYRDDKALKKAVTDFLNDDRWYDWEEYALREDVQCYGITTIRQAINFIKNNMEMKDLEKFWYKVLPFEPSNRLTKEQAEKKKKDVLEVAERISFNVAGIIDILKVSDNLAQYRYMIKQLRSNYRLLSQAAFSKNDEVLEILRNYNTDTSDSIRFTRYTEEQSKAVKNLVKESGLKVNDTTLSSGNFTAIYLGIVPETRSINWVEKYNQYAKNKIKRELNSKKR